MFPPIPLQQLHDLDRASPQFHEQLRDFLRGDEYRNAVPNLQSEDLVWLVEYLDNVLFGFSSPTSAAFQESLDELRKICSIREVLPRSCTLSDSLLDVDLLPTSEGVYEGSFNGSRVRVKRITAYPKGDSQKTKETFYQVAVLWKHSTHPNIIPLLGATTSPLQLISDWVPGGDLIEYIVNNPDAGRLGLLSGVAEGLNYLHSSNAIHGDLRGPNVLVDATGRARINFGLAAVAQNLHLIRGASVEHGHSARWIAPEILDDRGTYSKEGDIFSFAMVTIEAFTGAVPFSDKRPRAAMLAIVCGERPPRPTHPTLTDGLWALTQRCWDQEAHRRPQVPQILCSLGIPAWKRLINDPLLMHERIPLITAIFSDKREIRVVQGLRGQDAQAFIDIIDEALDLPNLAPNLWRGCLRTLCKVCGRQGLLPRSLQIPPCYNRFDIPRYRGGYADVWMGHHQGRQVAVKVLRVYSTSDFDKIINKFCREVMTWKTLRHPNVLSLLGVTMANKQFAMASEWMVNGNINEFVEAHGDVNRFELFQDIAKGLIYMHGREMIHGDLKGANVLVDQEGHARLADFGLLAIVSDPGYPTTSSSYTKAGTTRWMSPELINPDQFGFRNSRPTKESDCYALGMVIYEVLTGQPPFALYKDFVAMQKVIKGERPGKPQGAEGTWFTHELWEMLELCWSPQSTNRPTTEVVLECLRQVSPTWQPLPPCASGNTEPDTDDGSCSTVSGPISAPPSPRSLMVPSTVGPLSWGPSDILSVEIMGSGGVFLPSQAAPLQPENGYNVVRGNLTDRNILVDNSGIACITGYGLELALRNEPPSQPTPTDIRWMAPEVLSTESEPTISLDDCKRADAHSFAMVMLMLGALSGTVPFPCDSAEEVVRRVTIEDRPEWSSNNPSQALVDALWDWVESCCSQEPTAVPMEDREDDAEWERDDGATEGPPLTHKESKEHHSSHGLSGTTPVPLFRLSNFMSSHHGGSGGKQGHKSRRKRAEKHVWSILPRHAPGAVGKWKLAAEKSMPGDEIVDKREEEVSVRDGEVSYLISRPIPEGKTLKKVVITVVSKDQGWSSFFIDQGTYRNSWTWFELSVGPPKDSGEEGEKWRGEVVRNLHAHDSFKKHTIEISDEELYEKAKSGDVLTVWALARYPGWRNTVKKVEVRYVVE